MGIEALTTTDSSQRLVPTGAAGWSDWVSATASRNYVLGNALVDWLDLYGEQRGFVRDSTCRAMTSVSSSPCSSWQRAQSSRPPSEGT